MLCTTQPDCTVELKLGVYDKISFFFCLCVCKKKTLNNNKKSTDFMR